MDEPRNPSDHPLPGSVSNQNQEEAEPGHGDEPETGRPPGEAGRTESEGSGGESGEGSQSTGNPRGAG